MKLKKLLAFVTSMVTIANVASIQSVHAENNGEPYTYTIFASSDKDGAITVNSNNFSVNGDVTTNGTIVSGGNVNINGKKTEHANESMIYIFDKIENTYFNNTNIDEHDEDYVLDEMNINIDIPTEVFGETTLTGNININTAFKSLEDINLNGEVKNTNNSVIFSKYGDINIDSQNVNLNGLVYAPFGDVNINAQNLNLNNVVIIAENVTFTCPSINANRSNSVANFVGSESENYVPDYSEWEYLTDSDGDKLPDYLEDELKIDKNSTDSDGDGLDDYYEFYRPCKGRYR